MSTNIQDPEGLRASGLKKGDRVHLGVCGNHVTDSAIYLGELLEGGVGARDVETATDLAILQAQSPNSGSTFFEDGRLKAQLGIRVMVEGREIDLAWGDIIELSPAQSLKEIDAEKAAE